MRLPILTLRSSFWATRHLQIPCAFVKDVKSPGYCTFGAAMQIVPCGFCCDRRTSYARRGTITEHGWGQSRHSLRFGGNRHRCGIVLDLGGNVQLASIVENRQRQNPRREIRGARDTDGYAVDDAKPQVRSPQ